eukprot:GHVQ01001648.1.p1 GENE.GHVQ01001648.1~~GHVQ01001648.1.p1  ORF type:complete len:987 (-),score=113.87 GHVQ01001648.1:365-3325(-)
MEAKDSPRDSVSSPYLTIPSYRFFVPLPLASPTSSCLSSKSEHASEQQAHPLPSLTLLPNMPPELPSQSRLETTPAHIPSPPVLSSPAIPFPFQSVLPPSLSLHCPPYSPCSSERFFSSFCSNLPQCSCKKTPTGNCERFKRWWRLGEVDCLVSTKLYSSIADFMDRFVWIASEGETDDPIAPLSQEKGTETTIETDSSRLEAEAQNKACPLREGAPVGARSEQNHGQENCMKKRSDSQTVLDRGSMNHAASAIHETVDKISTDRVEGGGGGRWVRVAELVLPGPVYNAVLMDIGRTYPSVEFYKVGFGQELLRRVLNAYAFYDPEVGYVQGMNFLAAILLWHCSDEKEAFCLLVALMQLYDLRCMFLPQLPGVFKRCSVLKRLLRTYYQSILDHLETANVEIPMLAADWLMTLFAYSIPIEPLGQLWDDFFEEGWISIYRLILERLSRLKGKIIGISDVADIMRIVKYGSPPSGFTTFGEFFKGWMPQSLKQPDKGTAYDSIVSEWTRHFINSHYRDRRIELESQVSNDPNKVGSPESWQELIESSRKLVLDRHEVLDLESRFVDRQWATPARMESLEGSVDSGDEDLTDFTLTDRARKHSITTSIRANVTPPRSIPAGGQTTGECSCRAVGNPGDNNRDHMGGFTGGQKDMAANIQSEHEPTDSNFLVKESTGTTSFPVPAAATTDTACPDACFDAAGSVSDVTGTHRGGRPAMYSEQNEYDWHRQSKLSLWCYPSPTRRVSDSVVDQSTVGETNERCDLSDHAISKSPSTSAQAHKSDDRCQPEAALDGVCGSSLPASFVPTPAAGGSTSTIACGLSQKSRLFVSTAPAAETGVMSSGGSRNCLSSPKWTSLSPRTSLSQSRHQPVHEAIGVQQLLKSGYLEIAPAVQAARAECASHHNLQGDERLHLRKLVHSIMANTNESKLPESLSKWTTGRGGRRVARGSRRRQASLCRRDSEEGESSSPANVDDILESESLTAAAACR